MRSDEQLISMLVENLAIVIVIYNKILLHTDIGFRMNQILPDE